MSYGPPYAPQMTPEPSRAKRSRKLFWAMTFAGIAATFFVCAGVTTAITSSPPSSDDSVPPAASAAAQIGTVSQTASPRIPDTLTPADMSLKVKTKSRECFGSAGCNVQFSVLLTLKKDPASAAPCDVTYEIRGLEDPQIHTLTVDDQGMYEQDSFQFGSTSSSRKALTAKITEVSC